MNRLRLRSRRKRVAISEVFGSLIMIAVTLIAGVAVFGFINGQAGSSAQAVGNSAAGNINFLNEREVVLTAAYVSSAQATVWVYNNGDISPESIVNVVVTASNPAGVCAVTLAPSAAVGKQSVAPITVDVGACSGFGFQRSGSGNNYFYTFKVTGYYGSTAQATVQF